MIGYLKKFSDSVDSAHSFYYYWTFVVYLAFLYNAFMCVIFVFDDTNDLPFFQNWLILNLFVDIIYLFDIFVNAKLSYTFI